MRICLLSDPGYLHTERWARYFLRKGHDVCVVAPDGENTVVIPDIKTYSLKIEKYWGPWVVRMTLALRDLLKDIQPDILHMHYLGCYIVPVILRFRPFIVSVWGADIIGEVGLAADPWRERFFKRMILRKADAVVALSRFLAASTCEYSGLSPERVSTYYWGVDLKQFVPKRMTRRLSENDPVVIGFVKHLLPKYGAEFLMRAVPLIRAVCPNVKLLMIGEGPLRSQLESLAGRLGIADIVKFMGYVPHEEVPSYMAQIDIFVMPSIYESETFGVAAIEAQAMGIPVVATKIGGVEEAVLDGVTGLLVSPRNEKAIAEAVIRLVTDKKLRESMSREGPRFVARHFDWEKNAELVELMYYSLLERTR